MPFLFLLNAPLVYIFWLSFECTYILFVASSNATFSPHTKHTPHLKSYSKLSKPFTHTFSLFISLTSVCLLPHSIHLLHIPICFRKMSKQDFIKMPVISFSYIKELKICWSILLEKYVYVFTKM